MKEGPRSVRLGIALFGVFVLHAAYGSGFTLYGAQPNLALAALFVTCLYVDANTGAAFGFAVGLLEASYTARYVGSLLITRSLAGWIVGTLEERIFRDNVLFAILITLSGSFLVEALFFVFAPQPYAFRWLTRAMLTSVYNAVLAIPLYFLIRRLARTKER